MTLSLKIGKSYLSEENKVVKIIKYAVHSPTALIGDNGVCYNYDGTACRISPSRYDLVAEMVEKEKEVSPPADKKDKKFFLVWSPQGKTNPSVRHVSYNLALQESERLAKLNPGQEFIVLQSRRGIVYGRIETINYRE